MRKNIPLLVGLGLLLLGSVAQAGSYGPYFPEEYRCRPDTFGEAFRQARDSQILNPNPQWELEPVEGMEGDVAESVYMNYLKGMSKKSGGSSGSGGGLGYLPVISSPDGAK